MEAALFYAFAAMTLAGAAGVVTARHVVHAAVLLLLTLLGVAALYVLLGAEFLAAAQLVIYVGGTLVLLIFGVMLTGGLATRLMVVGRAEAVVVGIAGTCLLAALVTATLATRFAAVPLQPSSDAAGRLGTALLGDFLLPFEVASVLMLSVMIGAAYLARRRPKEQTDGGAT